jgi:hypothetical protein
MDRCLLLQTVSLLIRNRLHRVEVISITNSVYTNTNMDQHSLLNAAHSSLLICHLLLLPVSTIFGRDGAANLAV